MKNENIQKLIFTIFNFSRVLRKHSKSDNYKEKTHFNLIATIALKFVVEKSPTLKEIADYLTITAPSTFEIINALEEKGLVKRIPSKTDHRQIQIVITKKGQNEYEKMLEKITQKTKGYLLNKLSNKELETLVKILEKINYEKS